MKVTALVVCMLIVGNASAATKYDVLHAQVQERIDFGVVVEDLLKSLFDLMGHIDPVDVSELGFNILGYKIYIKDFHFEGFSKIVPEVTVDVELTAIKFKLGASAQKLAFKLGQWESSLKPIYGNGTAGLELNEISFLLSFDFSYFKGFQPSTVSTSLKRGNVQLTGFQNNQALSEQIVGVVDLALNVLYPSEIFQNIIEGMFNSAIGAAYRKSINH